MFNTTTKNEYNITYKKIKCIQNTLSKGGPYLKKIETYFKKDTSSNLKIYTNKNTIKEIMYELSNRYINNNIITFDNNKYSIDIYSYNNYYIIDCFHMNTITMQNYKKLIYEIHSLIVNDKIKRQQYTNADTEKLYIVVDNINKLEFNKVKVIQHVFNNKIFSNKPMFNYIEMHYYIKNNDNDYLQSQCDMFMEFNTIDDKTDDASISNIIKMSKNDLYDFIQNEFCNEKYSIDLILKIYKHVINSIVKSLLSADDKIQLMNEMTTILDEFNCYHSIDTMKHLTYENFIIDTIRISNSISN